MKKVIIMSFVSGLLIGVFASVFYVANTTHRISESEIMDNHISVMIDAIFLSEGQNQELLDIKRSVLENQIFSQEYSKDDPLIQRKIDVITQQILRFYGSLEEDVPEVAQSWIERNKYK